MKENCFLKMVDLNYYTTSDKNHRIALQFFSALGPFDEDRELVSYDEETELERGILRSENGKYLLASKQYTLK